MLAAARNLLGSLFRRAMVVGPLFVKELRVSSRRRRNYLLRTAYLGVLGLFVVGVWLSVVQWADLGSGAYRVSRMAEAGKRVISMIIWFQFVAAQVVAVILMSTSVSGEVQHRTFPALMTAPISDFQIVAGKLAGGLLPLLVLLAISFPLLAIVRVFGGVPWDFVLAGLCITLTATIFVGTVTMMFSILFRKAFASILAALGATIAFYGLLPLKLMALVLILSLADPKLACLAFHVNPPGMMALNHQLLMDPSSASSLIVFWPAHCLIMLALSLVLLRVCAWLLRRVALRRALGGDLGLPPLPGGPLPPLLPVSGRAPLPPPGEAEIATSPALPGLGVARPAGAVAPGRADEVATALWPRAAPRPGQSAPQIEELAAAVATIPIRDADLGIETIAGSPILWKEMRARLMRNRDLRLAGVVTACLASLVAYALVGLTAGVSGDGAPYAHATFAAVCLLFGLVAPIVLSAACITSEKETGCWPILMTTPLDDGHVLWAKTAGVLRRSWPGWVPLGGYLVLFTLFGAIHPLAAVLVALWAGGATAFLIGGGLYFSARFRRTPSAVAANLALAAVLWLILPVITGIMSSILHDSEASGSDLALAVNPIVQVHLVMGELTCRWHAAASQRVSCPHLFGMLGVPGMAAVQLALAATYAGLGWLLARLAARRFRRDIF